MSNVDYPTATYEKRLDAAKVTARSNEAYWVLRDLDDLRLPEDVKIEDLSRHILTLISNVVPNVMYSELRQCIRENRTEEAQEPKVAAIRDTWMKRLGRALPANDDDGIVMVVDQLVNRLISNIIEQLDEGELHEMKKVKPSA